MKRNKCFSYKFSRPESRLKCERERQKKEGKNEKINVSKIQMILN